MKLQIAGIKRHGVSVMSRVMKMTPDTSHLGRFHEKEAAIRSGALQLMIIRYNLSGVVDRRLIGGDGAKPGRFSVDFPYD